MNLKIFNLRDKCEFLEEVVTLEHNEWAQAPKENFKQRIHDKMKRVMGSFEKDDFCKLILVRGDELIGFISIFPQNCDKYPNLGPWYATMYVKSAFRGKGYSRVLNEAILEEARKRGFSEIYLKSDLDGYYEKFGAKFVENIDEREKLYKFILR